VEPHVQGASSSMEPFFTKRMSLVALRILLHNHHDTLNPRHSQSSPPVVIWPDPMPKGTLQTRSTGNNPLVRWATPAMCTAMNTSCSRHHRHSTHKRSPSQTLHRSSALRLELSIFAPPSASNTWCSSATLTCRLA
jgi:hypothetical protein